MLNEIEKVLAHWRSSVSNGYSIPDGNVELEREIPVLANMIARTARWVNPETFRRLPVWCPHTARGQQLFDAKWSRMRTNTRQVTGNTLSKFEGNVEALIALRAALGVSSPRPKNWTTCHIWGYDDPSFNQSKSIVHSPRYYSCVANMVWLPSALKGFTDVMPEIKIMLRICAYHLYGWYCEDGPTIDQQRVLSGVTPIGYPETWPSAEHPGREPPGTTPFSAQIEREIQKRKRIIKASIEDSSLVNYPRDQVLDVLKYWHIEL